MNAEDDKLTELKKVFADVIFNINKEAAMRVKSLEKKAAQYQHKLEGGKEEGVRLLLHIKQMMDFKIKQADDASQYQKHKIEELEAQLNEAEDIVKDLRDELGEAQSELERLKKDNLQRSIEPTNSFSREMESGVYSNKSTKCPNSEEKLSDVAMPDPSQRNEFCKCESEMVCTCGSYIRDQGFLSMPLRGKEAGLYRNGFTQRVRACESNLSDKSTCLLSETDKVKDENNCGELMQREQEEGEDTSKAPCSEAKTLSELEKKLLPGSKFSSIFQSFSHKRKRAARVKKAATPLSGKHVPVLVEVSANLSENSSKTAPLLSREKTETQTRLGFQKASGKETKLVETSSDTILQKDEESKDKMVAIEDETGFAEILSSPGCKVDVENFDVLSNGLEPIYSPSVGKRVIKYTFQRKRKREASSGCKMTDVEIETEIEMGVDQNNDQNVEKYVTKESSRESRRLAQVARQLISLSGKKRWD